MSVPRVAAALTRSIRLPGLAGLARQLDRRLDSAVGSCRSWSRFAASGLGTARTSTATTRSACPSLGGEPVSPADQLDDVIRLMREYVHLPVVDHVVFALAIAVGAELDGDPAWGQIVGP